MILDSVNAMLALGPAATPAGTAPNPTGQMLQTLGMLAIMGFIFYFLLIRPQQKKAKEHEALMKTIRTGDKITTSSGIIGTVVSIKDKSVAIRSADTKLEILKSAVAEINERSGESGAS
jgi:preprotein translocase subunit YajC